MLPTFILCTIFPILLINHCPEAAGTSTIHMRDYYDELVGAPYSTVDNDGNCQYYYSWRNQVQFFQAASFCAVKHHRLPLTEQNDLRLVNDILRRYYDTDSTAVWIIDPADPTICHVAKYDPLAIVATTEAKDCDSENNVVTLYDASTVETFCTAAGASKLTV